MIAQAEQIEDIELHDKIGELLERVARGVTITITRQNRPVAKLSAAEDDLLEQRRQAAADIRELRKGCRANGLDLRAAREEGRA
jgi:prevent-host-death family protein